MLESHRFISPDGLDWITQGRILGSNGLSLPVLRNIGYVLSSKLDWVMGGHGFIFALIGIAGLFLQGISLIMFLDYLKIKPKYQTVGIVIYFGSWIHFSSLYILPDSFAVGTLVFGTTLIAVKGIKSRKMMLISLFATLIGSLFQFYTFAGFIFALLLITSWRISFAVKILRVVFILFLMAISVGITILWRNSIPHDSVPSQFELLAIKLDMLPFYSEVWLSAFASILLLMLGFAGKKLIFASLRIELIKIYALFSLVFLALALFYQLPDARIAYSGISFSLITMIAIFLKSFAALDDTAIKDSRKLPGRTRGIVVTAIGFSLFLAPSNYWSPKFFETRPLHTWSLIMIRDVVRNEPSSYKDISFGIKGSCNDLGDRQRILDSIATSGFSPYEKNILGSYAKYYVCS